MGIRNSIAGALPALIDGYNQLKARANAMGIDFDIADFGGIRTFADTVLILGYRAADYAAAVAENPDTLNTPINDWRPIASFGSSYHNYGAAFDVKITQAPTGTSFSSALAQLKSIAPSVGLSSSVPNDPPHFELPIALEDAKSAWEAQGNTFVPTIAAGSTAAVLVVALLALAYFRRKS